MNDLINFEIKHTKACKNKDNSKYTNVVHLPLSCKCHPYLVNV